MAGDIERAHKRLTSQLIDLPGVAGVGVGSSGGKPCLKVYLESSDSTLRGKIPSRIDGVPVSIEQSGPIRRQ